MKYRIVGKLDKKIAKECNIEEHKNKKIILFEDRLKHIIDRHTIDFGSKENVLVVYKNIAKIISNPDYYFYNEKTKGLEYYKRINNNVCVAVRINQGKFLKVKSWYPVNKNKINNRKRQKEKNKINDIINI